MAARFGSRVSIGLAVLAAGALMLGALTALQLSRADTSDPFEGLSDAEKDRRIKEASAADDARQAAFVQSFARSGRDPSGLPRAEISVSRALEGTTLDEAVKQSDLVIHGSVVKTDFVFKGLVGAALVTIRVTETYKGQPAGEVRIQQMGGPMLQGGDEVLAEAETDPVLLPGQEVLLFLKAEPGLKEAGLVRVLAGTGQYSVTGGKVVPLELNPFAQEVAGLDVATFASRVRLAAAGDR